MRLGMDTFSIRFQGWNAFQMLDYAAGLGLDVVQFSTREDLASHDPGYLVELERHAEQLGLRIELGMWSIDRFSASFKGELGTAEAQVAQMCRAAAAVGSPVVRCIMGFQNDRLGPVPMGEHIAECVRVLRAAAPLARDLGVTVAVENHGWGDLLAGEIAALVEQAGPDTAGVTLDTGNPVFAAEDPAYVAEQVAPYVASTHFRDTAVWEHPQGAEGHWTVLGTGSADLKAVLRALEGKCRRNVAVCLETITGIAPRVIPYLVPDSDFWKMYPEMPARSLARFVALARHGTEAGIRPLEQLTGGVTPSTPPELAERLRAQQRDHFERSVAYAKAELGLGERDRRA